MKMVPKYSYVCEICGKDDFKTRYDCEQHEQICRERKLRRENCRCCYGRGYITKNVECEIYKEAPDGMPYKVWRNKLQDVPCPECNKY